MHGVEVQTREARAYMVLFGTICEGWSKGDGKPSFADYDKLDTASGRWVNECIDKVVEEARGELGKANGLPSKPKRSRSSSAKAESQAPAG